jgi:hypothetical protein
VQRRLMAAGGLRWRVTSFVGSRSTSGEGGTGSEEGLTAEDDDGRMWELTVRGLKQHRWPRWTKGRVVRGRVTLASYMEKGGAGGETRRRGGGRWPFKAGDIREKPGGGGFRR